MEHHLIAVQSEQTVHAMLELIAPDPPNTAERPPLHLALVIDRSGSMDGEKLATTKTCAAFLARRLAPDGAHRNSPEVLIEIPQVSSRVVFGS